MQKDRYNLNLFISGPKNDPEILNAQELSDDVYTASKLRIVTMAMDFPKQITPKHRKELEQKWIQVLPTLNNVTHLSVRHRVSQDFFEAICQMKNLERLGFRTSTVEDISSIKNLQKLKRLDLDSFSRLTDISPITKLTKLELLIVANCFKVTNYDIIGTMTQLVGLMLAGETIAPKNLRINSLTPFEHLTNLRHLDLHCLSVIDNSYDVILKMENLERFDISVIIPKHLRELIKQNHKKLKAGFFMDWDYDKKEIIEGKDW